jgi:hypothetical protein
MNRERMFAVGVIILLVLALVGYFVFFDKKDIRSREDFSRERSPKERPNLSGEEIAQMEICRENPDSEGCDFFPGGRR